MVLALQQCVTRMDELHKRKRRAEETELTHTMERASLRQPGEAGGGEEEGWTRVGGAK